MMGSIFVKYLLILAALVLLSTTILIFQNSSNKSESLPSRHRQFQSPNQIFSPQVLNQILVKPYPEKIQESIENLPDIYFSNTKLPEHDETCAKFPTFFDIKFTNNHWQTQITKNGTLQLFNAYFDHRNVSNDKKAIRIISMYDQFYTSDTFYCQFWYDNASPVFVKSENLTSMWRKEWGGNVKGLYHPYIITCLLPTEAVPKSVSVVDNVCDNANNNLKINFKTVEEDEKKNFVVCVKGLNFPEDMSTRLVEWIELLFILGADKISFYKYNVHPNMEKVLNYYTNFANVDVTPISLLFGASNSPYLQSYFLRHRFFEQVHLEVVEFNDCLYKHLKEFKFVVILDTDEVIVPINGSTWVDLIEEIQTTDRSSYIAQNIYFLDSHNHNHGWFYGIPKFLHMLQHVYRSKTYTPWDSYVKGFHDTNRIITLHNHFPIDCFGGCHHLGIDLELAHLQHYRRDCVVDVTNCDSLKKNSVLDARVWNYKEVLIERALEVLFNLDLVAVPDSL